MVENWYGDFNRSSTNTDNAERRKEVVTLEKNSFGKP